MDQMEERPMTTDYPISIAPQDPRSLIALCRSGFSTKTFNEVATCLQLPDLRLAKIIHIPKSTLTRRKKEGRFSFEESERLYRIIRLFNLATEIFEAQANASKWLNSPSKDFEGKSPLEYADTEIGAREVEAALDRIADGVIF
jgi:putative toxin-antitoxin system antitoxin component (TIGR02293 family)